MDVMSMEVMTDAIESSPPVKPTATLKIPADQIEKSLIAQKQLENLSAKKPRKKSTQPDNTNVKPKDPDETQTSSEIPAVSELLYDQQHRTTSSLTSAIVSKEEIEDEIRKRMIDTKPNTSYDVGAIEIPQELILSEINPASKDNDQLENPLDEQQLIDILEGKDDQDEQIIEFGDHGMIIVKDNNDDKLASYEIISTENEKMSATKQKLLEREIAMRQMASMPVRKNRKLKQIPSTVQKPTTSIAQTLAMDWYEDDKGEEVILELENIEGGDEEPKIKILNMTILNESKEEIKSPTPVVQQKVNTPQLSIFKSEPKILNKNAPKINPPKILNVNAPKSSSEEPKRVPKKKTIWDPSTSSPQEKKITASKLPINLPPTITIKKLTKDSITTKADKSAQPDVEIQQTSNTKKGKKKSEIDKLFQDEGAVNMIYSLERQNNNTDVPEIEGSVDKQSIDPTEEKTKLIAKAKTIKQTIMKQSTSPQEAKQTPARPQRIKREVTPVKSESETEKKAVQEKTVIITKAQKTPATGRKRKTDDSWDYVLKAQTTCDDAMIIRRHSNSSYSSSAPTSPRRLSLDQAPECAPDGVKNNFKFTKPQQKSPEIQKDLKSCVGGLVEELRNTLSSKLAKGKANQEKTVKGKKRITMTTSQESPPSKRANRSNGTEKEYKMIKDDGVVHIILSSNPITLTLLTEIKTALVCLEQDEACKVVLITSSSDFSHGLDYSTLVQNTVDKRKQAASDLVTAVKNFFVFLAAFPKVLVCGLKGSVSGIAVSMLPLFDVVVAENSTKFSIPHASIGSNPEGISILQSSNKINSNIITEMFYMSEKLNATTALNYGLISKVVPNHMEANVKDICKKISTLSSQSLELTKNILSEDFLSSLDQHLSKEVKILQLQWISSECQENFKKISSAGSC